MTNKKRNTRILANLLGISLLLPFAPLMASAHGGLFDKVPSLSTEQLLRENAGLRRLFTETPANPQQFAGKRIAILTTDGVEQIELEANRDFFKKRGALVEIVAPHLPQYPEKFGVHYPEIRADHILTVRFFDVWTKRKIF